PEARLQGERGRTTGQLRLFADHITKGDYLDRRHDAALPDRQPIPRPDLKMVQRPIGPVAVFGASNFPLAFSTAGGDTASALAAGCPVVVKGHPAHPGTTEIVAQAIAAAITATGAHPGTFNMIQGDSQDVGSALVQHPLISAVGFTGSLGGGRALFDLCAKRPVPIPFFGELGSVNPMFVLPVASATRGAAIAEGWAASLTMGAGQFCTNPGVVVLIDGPEADTFVASASSALGKTGAQTMLTEGIAGAYRAGRDRIAAAQSVREVLTSTCGPREATGDLYETTGRAWLANKSLSHEVFGPLGLIVRVADIDEMLAVARSLDGQLTCTLQIDEGDTANAQSLVPVLERKAGRLLVNGFPTGVEVADAMVHGGPYPASTNFGHTSVGTLAIRRFLRPVCYQNFPETLYAGVLSGT
ncbi:MAG: aldehyde dehydrogenase (NADP(+)), partial [Sulfitobacter sp.]